MKIILVAPKTITKHRHSDDVFLYDYAYWNFFLPLQELGHEVYFHDTSFKKRYPDEILKNDIYALEPDLLFCIMTGDSGYCPSEPWEAIKETTRENKISTFNWFCDDSWRFESFSSKVCHHFHIVSTTEFHFQQKYKEFGYDEVIYAPWHANRSLYSHVNALKIHDFAFVGNRSGSDRNSFIKHLEKETGKTVFSPQNVGIEGLIETYSRAKIGLSFSKSMHNGQARAKARPFEIIAAGSMLMVEHFEGIERLFEVDKEVVTFRTPVELAKKAKYLLENPKMMENIQKAGFNRYLFEHSSKLRLKRILKDIEYGRNRQKREDLHQKKRFWGLEMDL